jgi:Ran GTPase-activating protein (RanGAP) involved in mRNA processing and transport
VNKTLMTLNVARNSIGDTGASDLADALKMNKTLTELDVGFNDIGDAGASALAEALKVNTTLMTLNVAGNSLGDACKTLDSRTALRSAARPGCTVCV